MWKSTSEAIAEELLQELVGRWETLDVGSVFAQDQLAALWRVSFPSSPLETPLTPHPRWLELGFSSPEPWLDIHTTLHLHCILYVAEHQHKLYMQLLRRNDFPVMQTLVTLLDTLVAHIDGKAPCPCCSAPRQGALYDGLECLYEQRQGNELELLFTRMIIEYQASSAPLSRRLRETRQRMEALVRQRPAVHALLTTPIQPSWCDVCRVLSPY
ncbi:hypothetical protein SDRG_15180 [Saprolegnia diclina VS20]|uniref:ELMO domain-containing protein n=1 Tax=Saprolegnia diclina (strain VS20) TaxID=1156394 RepID=T0PNJ8_SAPDV|nr:hypothetical protein SDRG_15180 [Saprolegnia diclina VS20]EQC26964.1 hypothetical protein SDRG_15180 [Saprolegnia diclina VS20]|eukprot:XP_008619566.1 hypothetical protein SDRG_15180 [Saprolegnia diclina VS20]